MNRKQNASQSSSHKSGLKRSKPAPLALEARLMFDGAAVATAVADAVPPDAHVDSTVDAPAAAQTEALREGAQAVESAVREVVFIDPGVSDWQVLAAGINPNAELVMLDPTRDGLTQIAEALQGKSGLDAIHIVSHGTEGGIILGGSTYDADALAQHQGDLAAIGAALTESGDVLIYGCDVAAGSVGEAFVNALADATQADVAASVDTTGSAAQGGDWQLEYVNGQIESWAFANSDVLNAYEGKLAPPSPSITDSDNDANRVAENAQAGDSAQVDAQANNLSGSGSVRYSLTDDAGGRFRIDRDNGKVSVRSGANLDYESAANSEHQFTITVKAVRGSNFVTQDFVIFLSDVDEFNVSNVTDKDNSANSVNENVVNGTSVGITAFASDADGTNNLVTYSLTNNAGGRFGVDAGTGVVTVTNGSLLDRESAASHTITVKATSADGSSSTRDFTITVADVNEAPIITVPVTEVSTFSSVSPISIPDSGPATPSVINVSGLSGEVSKLTVSLKLTHTWPDDVDILLVGPQGQRVLLMSDAGGSSDVDNLQLTFDQTAGNSLSDDGQLVNGTFRPSNFGWVSDFSGTYGMDLSVFNGQNPNGAWTLQVIDDAGGDRGSISSWSLDVTTVTDRTTVTLPDAYTEGASPVLIGAKVDLSDIDDVNLAGAIVKITSPVLGDVLSLTPQSGINQTYDAASGTLTLSGTATVAQYQAALRSVTFVSSSENPTSYGDRTSREITWTVKDAGHIGSQLSSAPLVTTLSVVGLNDAPEVSGAVLQSATEDGSVVVADALAHASDADSRTLSVVSVPESLPAGVSYDAVTHRFSLNPANAAYQSLAQGETLNVVVSYGVSDGLLTTPASVKFTVTGTNDGPVITSLADAAKGTVIEAGYQIDGTSVVTGQLSAEDKDAGATQAWTLVSSTAGTYGSIAIDAATGLWTYTLDNSLAATQALKPTDTKTETFTARVTDDKGAYVNQVIKVTVKGTNDAPVAVADTGAVDENGTLNSDFFLTGTKEGVINGVITGWGGFLNLTPRYSPADTDVDNKTSDLKVAAVGVGSSVDASNVGSYITGAYGQLKLNSDGTYTYKANTLDAERLSAGEIRTDQFSYVVKDPLGALSVKTTLTITVTGTNDAPEITFLKFDSQSVTEDGSEATSGLITFLDIDQSDNHRVSILRSPLALGTLVAEISDSADQVSLSYSVANEDIQFLAEGQVWKDSFLVSLSDGKGGIAIRTVIVEINGTNDAPEIMLDASQTEAWLTEDAVGDYGDNVALLTINVDSEVLPPPDAPAPELTASGEIKFNDLDLKDHWLKSWLNSNELGSVSVSETSSNLVGGEGNVFGTLTATVVNDAEGSRDGKVVWEYTLSNEATQYLAEGQVATNVFTVTITDANGASVTQDVTIYITGVNDAPVIHADESGNGTVGDAFEQGTATPGEDATGNVLDSVTDVDVRDGKFVLGAYAGDGKGELVTGDENGDITLQGLYGVLTLHKDGTYTYTLNNNQAEVEVLSDGDELQEVFTYAVTDRDHSSPAPEAARFLRIGGEAGVAFAKLTITIHGADDVVVPPPDAAAGQNGDQGYNAQWAGYNGVNVGRTNGNLGAGGVPDPTGIGGSGQGNDGFNPEALLAANPTAAGNNDLGEGDFRHFELAAVDYNGQVDGYMLFAPPGVKMDFVLPKSLVEQSSGSFVAMRSNGDELPNWLRFDPVTGKFIGRAPQDMVGTINIQLTGKDAQGKDISIRVTLVIDPTLENVREQSDANRQAAADQAVVAKIAEKSVPRGRAGLTDQMKMASKGAIQGDRVAKAAPAPARSV